MRGNDFGATSRLQQDGGERNQNGSEGETQNA
jgi:hypothetical protein